MKKLLLNCYHDGMTVSEAISFISRCYQEKPTEKQLKDVKLLIKEFSKKEWN